MKHLLAVSIILFCYLGSFAQKNTQMKAYLDHKVFFEPSVGNYVEVYLQFLAPTLKYVGHEGGLQAEIAVQLIFRKGETVAASDAYRLMSPVMRDSIIEDFYDLRRVALAPGMYELEISLEDLNAKNAPLTGRQTIEIRERGDQPWISDMQISEVMTKTDSVSMFTKSGYEMIPRILNYFSNEATTIPVYFEMYSPDKTPQTFGLKQSIRNVQTNAEVESFVRYSRHDVLQVQPIVRVLDITNLPSGEYNLEYTLISKDSEELTKTSYFFERANDLIQTISSETIVLDPAFQASISEDSVFYYMESLIPISKQAEVKNIISILKKKDIEQSRKYIQAFWVMSSGNDKPYDAWMKYKGQVQLVQRLFSNNFMEGFETDRGRVYLQYGPPSNIIVRETSPSEYPYEIWQYDKINKYSNKRFVFYNPDLVNNNYRLLHSDMIGELQNYRWQQALAKRNSPNRNIDDPNDGNQQHWGGNSRELFEQK